MDYKILSEKIATKPILQVLHVKQSHWATLYAIDDDISYYDSAYNTCDEATMEIISQLLRPKTDVMEIKVMNLSKQSGSVDCGLYAIAYLVCLALGTSDPITIVFDQDTLRPQTCFSEQKITEFPTL